jgi:hypothetical protein
VGIFVLGGLAVLVLAGLVLAVVVFNLLGQRALSSQSCQYFDTEWPELESAWRRNRVTLDGRMTRSREWLDATCLDLVLGHPDWSSEDKQWSDTILSRWWIKNDEEWLYLLVRVPIAEFEARGAALDYFWPEWTEEHGWAHSDASSVSLEGETNDAHGWNEEDWHEDVLASPPGENNVEGAAREDGTYYWFEFRKALDSGDGYDWSLSPGDVIGVAEDSALFVVWGEEGPDVWTWFELNVQLHLGQE